jgi:hypothetical protein
LATTWLPRRGWYGSRRLHIRPALKHLLARPNSRYTRLSWLWMSLLPFDPTCCLRSEVF